MPRGTKHRMNARVMALREEAAARMSIGDEAFRNALFGPAP
jgi:hypothetical protein